MYPNVYNDLRDTHCKVIFLVTTAGDSGRDKIYWHAREEGLKSSVRFCLAPHEDHLLESAGASFFNNHLINHWAVNDNTIAYFLRLPDGNLNGKGFARYNFASLSKFKSQEINSIEATDTSAVYSCWDDLTDTIESIVNFERKDILNACITYLDPDQDANPNDHPDHIATGFAVQNIAAIATMRQFLCKGYGVHQSRRYLSAASLFWKAGMFAAYEKSVFDLCGYSTLQEDADLYIRWCRSRPKFFIIKP